MKIVFPPPVQGIAVPQSGIQERPAQDAAPPAATAGTPGVPPGRDAEIIRAAEAALKAGSMVDSRVAEIKRAVQEGRIRFDADVLATLILRYHGKQD